MASPASPRWGTVIVAAGSGQRFGGDVPKQYVPLGGRPVLAWSLDALSSLGPVAVVVDPTHKDFYAPILAQYPDAVAVPGGHLRQDSVIAGVRALHPRPEYVMIHDAARPFLPVQALPALQKAVEDGPGAATLAVPVVDTLVRDGEIVDRTGVHAVQTPQAFRTALLMDAYSKAGKAYTDDTSLVADLCGVQAILVPGCPDNFKITRSEELDWAERLVAMNMETRTGMGLDFHRFGPGDRVRLFGVDIPSPQSLVGHSDADAGLHAIADAILGTIGAGDIGVLFPPSDPQWKGMDSAVIVEKALQLLRERGGRLVNADIMLMSEFPRIGPHREAIIVRLTQLLGVKADAIGLKATTTEQMGFIGRGEGLAVQAVVTVKVAA